MRWAIVEWHDCSVNDRVPLRPQIESLPAYVPGARSATGAAAYKLSSNENPHPILPAVLCAIVDAAQEANRYPDMHAVELTAAIEQLVGVEPGQVVVGNGSVAVLGHVLQAVVNPDDEVIYGWRSFEAYPIVAAVAGGVAVEVPLLTGENDDGASAGRLDLPTMADAITDRTKVILVCSPNNPTGPVVHHQEMVDFLARVPKDVLVILDEAYIEFVRDPEVADGLALFAKHPNLVLLRTFSKAYALAGLRIGYAVARRRIADGVRSASTPFGVSHIAQQAALAALRVKDQLDAQVEHIVSERTRMVAALKAQGWKLPESHANFVWFPLGDAATTRAAEAAAAGVVVRPFAGDGVRVTVGEVEANDLFLDIAATWR